MTSILSQIYVILVYGNISFVEPSKRYHFLTFLFTNFYAFFYLGTQQPRNLLDFMNICRIYTHYFLTTP